MFPSPKRATSIYDLQLIEKRLAALQSHPQDDETQREIKYLEELKQRKFPQEHESHEESVI